MLGGAAPSDLAVQSTGPRRSALLHAPLPV